MEHAIDDVTATAVKQRQVRARTYYRGVFQYFRSRSTESATVDDLVTFFREQDLSDEDETGIAIYLHHAMLPRLADAGLVDYDARSNTARYRGPSTES